MSDLAIRRTLWLIILIWLAAGSGVVVVGAVALLGWLIALSAETVVAVAMWVTGQ